MTYRCNFRCIYCYNNSGPTQNDFLSTAQWLEAIKQLSEETDCQSILLSGGEPLIYPGFFDILAAGRHAGMIMDFTTNGSLVDDEAIRRFVDLGIHHVRVSLDSPYASVHHQLTQTTDTFRKVTHAIEEMSKAGISVEVKGILFDGNYKDAAELTIFAKNLGATQVMLDAYDCTNIGRGKQEMTLSKEHYAAVAKGKDKYGYTLRNSQHERNQEKDAIICRSWSKGITIAPNGNFPFCETLASNSFFLLGRFPADSIMKAWNSPQTYQILHPSKQQCDQKCQKCKLFKAATQAASKIK